MTESGFRLLYDMIHDFKTTAIHVESAITANGVRHDTMAPVPSMKNRMHVNTWLSMKAVSHFNLGTALELMLKLIMFISDIRAPHEHTLLDLFDSIPTEWQNRLDSRYKVIEQECPDYELVAFVCKDSPTVAPSGPSNRDLDGLRGMLGYFDTDVMMSKKRYSWELFNSGVWCHSMSDITVFTELIDRTMLDIGREFARKQARG